ncbi:hypothetical protein [Phormidesmis sp. 146-33]
MKAIGVTGARKLTKEQAAQAHYELWEVWHSNEGAIWHVGDATGIDEMARSTIEPDQLREHNSDGFEVWQLQQRSKRMIDALAADQGTLHAWVNKPCPAGLTVASWQGSGTWGTVRYAVSKGVPVVIHWLSEDCNLPEWMSQKQLSLL